MLKDIDAMATVAVRDLAAARAFYGGKLGLEENGEGEEAEATTFRSGAASIVVYRSDYAGTNQATSVTWGLGDEFDAVVAALEKAGVEFERYESLGMTLDGVVHVAGGFKAAWFTDPDGNILHVNNM